MLWQQGMADMKVVLFCGGQGMRMRGAASDVPKPLVMVRQRPLVWHVMRYYAHFGHTDFILCLGHGGRQIKDYFLSYDECDSNDFVLGEGGRAQPLQRDIEGWRITFVDTGEDATIAERLLAVRQYLAGEACFLANYADGLTDCPLPLLLAHHRKTGAGATFLSAPPNLSFHFVQRSREGNVSGLQDVADADLWVNAGFFVLDASVLDLIRPGDELVAAPFRRLIEAGRLATLPWRGFWQSVDTPKDLDVVQKHCRGAAAPWEFWRREPSGAARLPLPSRRRPAAYSLAN
jgi:glucose-1-phosphate cytidylyltransferase